jgi:hypothetical protein
MVAVAAAACDSSSPAGGPSQKSSPEPEAPRPAPEVAWEGKTMSVAGFPGATLGVSCCAEGMTATVSTAGWPDGTRFTAGAESWTAPAGGRSRTKVKVGALLGELSLARYHDVKAPPEAVAPTLPVTIQLPGPWQPITTSAPAGELTHHSAPLALAAIVDGPITFADEPTKAKPDTALVVKDHTRRLGPLFGPGVRLKDVDWVVVPFWKDTGKVKTCGGYSNVQGVSGSTKVSFALHDVELAIYDRRTGAVLGSKTFPPTGACPTYTSGDKPAIGADDKAMTAWVKAQLASGKVI